MDPDDIAEWLDGLGLGQYAETFADNDVETDILADLDEADLEKLGVSMGHRKRLLRAIAERSAGPDAAAAPAPETPASVEAERRQLTVMFCDMVGSTALSGRLDPEDMRDVIRAYQDTCAGVVARFGGFLAKYMGDGVLVYFGYPTAQEDDAERAVDAGLALVDAVAGLAYEPAVRIGIATGTVVVGDIVGEGASREAAITGDTPNLAARLQETAEPNQVVIAETTHALAGGLFDVADLGEHELKGLSGPVRLWRVDGAQATESRFDATRAGRLTSFVGREHEIALLLDRWERAKEGEGQVVLLSGEAGIGKSRIFQVLQQHLAEEPCTRLRYQCSPQYAASALQPIISQLDQAADIASNDPPEIRLGKIEHVLAQGTDDITAVLPLFAALMSVPAGERYPASDLSPQRQKELTLQALTDQLLGLASRQQVLMIFEDVQWIDPTTLEALTLMVDRIQSARVFAVITCRPEFESPWRGHTHVTMLTLNRLTRSQCGAMVERVTDGRALPRDVLDQIIAKTDGVPLFVEELTKTVLESEMLEDAGDRYELRGPLPTLAIPATLKDSLMARLDRLAPVKELAQTCAAIGREFPARLVAAVIEGDAAGLQRGLDQLVAAELVFRRGAGEDATYVFKHALVQDTAYESLLRSNRFRLHQRIAEALSDEFPDIAEAQPEILAHHYTEAGLAEPAIEHWLRAGERAAGRSAHAEAISHFDNALRILATLPADAERDARELNVLLRLGSSQMMARGHGAPEVEASYNRALALCRKVGERSLLVRALFGLWRYYIVVPDYGVCLDLCRQLLELAEASRDAIDLVLAHYTTGATQYFTGEFVAARTSLDQALALYDPEQRRSPAYVQGQDPAEACLIYRAMALWMLGSLDAAAESGRQALQHARHIENPFSEGHALLFHAMYDLLGRDRDSAAMHANALVELSDEYGFSAWGAGGRLYRDLLDTAIDPRDGADVLKKNMYMWGNVGAGIFGPFHHSLLAEFHSAAGRLDVALDEVESALDIVETNGERWWEMELLRLKGAILLDRDGDVGAAEACFLDALDIARSRCAKSLELRVSISLARLWHAQGRGPEARGLLAAIYEWFTDGFDTPDLTEAKALLENLS